MITYALCPSFFYEIWALFVSSITYDYLYNAPYLAVWTVFSLLVPAMCNPTACTLLHELPQSHIVGITKRTHCFHDYKSIHNVFSMYTLEQIFKRYQYFPSFEILSKNMASEKMGNICKKWVSISSLYI